MIPGFDGSSLAPAAKRSRPTSPVAAPTAASSPSRHHRSASAAPQLLAHQVVASHDLPLPPLPPAPPVPPLPQDALTLLATSLSSMQSLLAGQGAFVTEKDRRSAIMRDFEAIPGEIRRLLLEESKQFRFAFEKHNRYTRINAEFSAGKSTSRRFCLILHNGK